MHAPAYWAIRSVLGAMLTGDMAGNIRTARGLGRAWSRLEPRRVERTVETLGVAFPEMGLGARREYALRAYEHLFQLGVEMAYTPRAIAASTWSRHVRLGELGEAARLMLSGRSCVMITGHCGNWELLGYTMALLGFPMHALYRPLDLKPLDNWVRQTREKRGLVLVDKFGAAEAMPELVRRGKHVAFIADQNAGDRGLFVPFFNRMASTYKSIGLLALTAELPIICGQARRLESAADPFQYQVDVVDIIMPEDWRGQPDPLFYVSARYRRALEAMVRRAPEQNLWLHRYWKSRPRHEHQGRPIPPAVLDKVRALPWTTEEDVARLVDWAARDAATLAEKPPKPPGVRVRT
jgi:KDO2-lipid IV(A) lauroyltransferase